MEFADFIRIPCVDGVRLYELGSKPVEGTLCITGHHLILSSRQNQKEELWVSFYKFTVLVICILCHDNFVC